MTYNNNNNGIIIIIIIIIIVLESLFMLVLEILHCSRIIKLVKFYRLHNNIASLRPLDSNAPSNLKSCNFVLTRLDVHTRFLTVHKML